MTTAQEQMITDVLITGTGITQGGERIDPNSLHLPLHKIPLAKKHTSMKIDYRGMLGNAQHSMRVSDGFNRMMLDELCKHLTELGERYYQGDIAAVDEFLQLYCIGADKRTELAKATVRTPA